jgi:predicted RNase H-like nuclease (RuvC/YqgF family)
MRRIVETVATARSLGPLPPLGSNPVPFEIRAQSSEDITVLSTRMTRQAATLQQQERTIRQMKLQGQNEKEIFLREIQNLKEELKVKDEQIEALTEASRELQDRLSANENLFARVSAIEATLQDGTWQETVETKLRKMGMSICLVTDAANASVDNLKLAVQSAFAKMQSELNRIKYELERTGNGLVELHGAFAAADALKIASDRTDN